MAGVFVNRAGRSPHGELAFPGSREGRRVVDLEFVEQGIRVELELGVAPSHYERGTEHPDAAPLPEGGPVGERPEGEAVRL